MLMIDLLLLGNGAMVPLPDRPLSALLMRVNGALVLFDCGEGTQVQMRRFHWGFRALDAICLSHLHADHVAGLPGLLHTVANAGRSAPLQIYGPQGTAEVVDGLRVIAARLPYDIKVLELVDGDSFDLVSGARATVREGEHRMTCLGWRIDVDRAPEFDPEAATRLGVPRTEWSRLQRGETIRVGTRDILPEEVQGSPRPGIAFTFATDTRPTSEIAELASGVDLLVCESTYAGDDHAEKAAEWGHMTMPEACKLARSANVGALWLTHFGGTIADPNALKGAARALFPATETGYPGLAGTIAFDGGYRRLA